MVRFATALAAAAALAIGAAGCGGGGGGGRSAGTAQHTRRSPRARQLGRLAADVRALRSAAAKVHGNTLMGSPRLQRLTASYLHDLDTSTLDLRTKNRQIDFAVAAVTGTCGQCFQELEADRPIPALANGQ